MRVGLAQINVAVGDFAGNVRRIKEAVAQAKAAKAQLVIFPELAITGYPPEDLLFKPSFIQAGLRAVQEVARLSLRGPDLVVGFVDRAPEGRIFNAAAIAVGGKIVARYHKMMLPNYGVFDEKRYFTAGATPLVVSLRGVRVGVSICEDIWCDEGPLLNQVRAGAEILVNLSASPYHAGKLAVRERLLSRWARKTRRPILYVNLVGGQDELVFDGAGLAVEATGRIRGRGPQFQETVVTVDLPDPDLKRGRRWGAPLARPLPLMDEIYEALVLGTRDYVRKNGFTDAVLGMSGGIDSALTAAIAAEALGPSHVTAVSMPSPYNSMETRQDARAVVESLGVRYRMIPITPALQAFQEMLKEAFSDRPADVTEENLQARIRGTILMALSNKFGWLVLSTGNKSELSTGYCTLYGDMVGGFAVLKDVPKTWVYRLARVANRRAQKPVIPESVFTRPPTAELKPHQTDQDTLPPYPVLDRIVTAYVEQDRPVTQLKGLGPPRILSRVIRMIDGAEYKRRQAPPGIKITPRAFGKDRRMPITNKFLESGL